MEVIFKMGKYYVIYSLSEVIWCWEDEAFQKMSEGWKLYAITDTEKEAEQFCEEACYLP
jgi:hypothetical protein